MPRLSALAAEPLKLARANAWQTADRIVRLLGAFGSPQLWGPART